MSYAVISCKKKQFINYTEVEEICQEVTIKIPRFKENQTSKKGKKINKLLKKYKVSNVVLSNELNKNNELKKIIYQNNNYIITGNRMYKTLLPKTVKEISEYTKIEMETLKIAILVDEFSIENLDLIKTIAKRVKQVLIVSKNEQKFKRLADEIMNKEWIIIQLIKKGKYNLKRNQIILNLDFSKDDLRNYTIGRYSIIINVKNEIEQLGKNFEGIIINTIDIYLNEEKKGFNTLALCEAYIYNYLKKIKENELIFNKSGYKINSYIGTKGIITTEDFERIGEKIVEDKVKKPKNRLTKEGNMIII